MVINNGGIVETGIAMGIVIGEWLIRMVQG
jgi:hypothetical protein